MELLRESGEQKARHPEGGSPPGPLIGLRGELEGNLCARVLPGVPGVGGMGRSRALVLPAHPSGVRERGGRGQVAKAWAGLRGGKGVGFPGVF